ncbi:DUF4153 domain-containing protein [Bacillus sp. FJAT-49711]|uniref:DUF4153 domain-containing protein n=1 Tax=Bacillus sp. FJAT-49711 TaxID=2833585 RepID=UPI001BCA3B98|nr:DUF4153 domain-containing protein [Bacillus sp. FJAT-49711]MBS4217517.1 DUF4153 domain-containing protein [Bacillus sp. FJAT-49711]
MKNLRNKLIGLIQAVNRYPLTMLFLLAIATVNVNMINSETEDYLKYLFTFIIGSLLSVIGQQVYERFFIKVSERLVLMFGSILLTAGYYFAIHSASTFSLEIGTKTAISIFALMMAFIWIPAIKSKVTFNESFMSAFKAFFLTVLFSSVLAAGLNLIIIAIDQLLFSLDLKTYAHVLNIVLSLFAPVFFLSYTPPYPGKKDSNRPTNELSGEWEKIEKAITCPKTLGILISFIIIPLTAVYTIILLAYTILNIRGDFWTNNLLEPMLVSYAITVILVYILSSHLEDRFAKLFRKIFPKILIPIVLFQTVASILKISDIGVTYGRYYAIMFGIFALIAGIVFSFFPVKRNGLIASVLIVFSAVSIIPPVDAFTVAKVSQVHLLKRTLVENDMFQNGKIVPNSDISIDDKKTITRTASYLNDLNYIAEIDWLPAKLFNVDNFNKTFGFEETYDQPTDRSEGKYAHINWERSPAVNIENYDRMIHLYFQGSQTDLKIPIQIENKTYILKNDNRKDPTLILVDEQNNELFRFDMKKAIDQIFENHLESDSGKNMLPAEKMMVTQENDKVKMTILAASIDNYDSQYNADIFVFLKIK